MHAACVSPLSLERLDDFHRDGFLVLREFYSPEKTAEIGRWVDDLVARPLVRGGLMVYQEDSLLSQGKRIVSRIEKFADFHDGFRRMIHDPRMMEAVSQLLGGPAALFKEKINFKLPGGAGFKPHQDIQPGWDDYAPFFLSVLVTIDESTIENGCLEFAAGHHTRGWIGRRHAPLEGAELEGMVFEKYPMQPGDVAFFDCFAPHQSADNLTDRPRRSLYLTFNRMSDGDHRDQYFADKRRSFPPDHERKPGKDYRFKV